MSSGDLPMLAVTIPIAAIAGLLVGSFLNVVAFRTALGLSVSTPRSFCPSCRRRLTWWENVPVVSWVGLRGRCRTCRHPISVRYPLVEAATGAVFALVTWGWHGTVPAAAYCILAATMIVVSLVELDGRRSPLAIAAIGTVAAQTIIVAEGAYHHHWDIVTGSLSGSAAAVVALSLLRWRDPGCRDLRWHGRTALLVAGCWAGGLGPGPTAIGALAWIGTYAACLLGVWRSSGEGGAGDRTAVFDNRLRSVVGVPLVSAIGVAMVASLVVGT